MGDLRRSIRWASIRWARACTGVLAAAGLLSALASGAAVAQVVAQKIDTPPKTVLMEPPAPLLPQTLGKLARVAEGESGDGLGEVDAADAPVMKEAGIKRFARSAYSQGGADRGSVTVYQFKDASGAVAACDYLRKLGMRPEKLGDSAAANADELLFRSGVSVVVAHLKLDHDATLAFARDLISHLPKVGGPSALAPPLLAFLPAKGIDAESVKYALGPLGYQSTGGVLSAQTVGFDKSAETVTAKYKPGGTLTLIEYPTPQIAGDRGRAIEAELKQPVESSTAGTVKVRREGPLLMVTTGAWKPDAAQAMVDGIHLHDVMSFDKPLPLDFHVEVRKTFSLLTSIAILCGVGALAAIVLGLFFGGGRALIRVMQGKPAATEPEFLRIDLRGPVGKSLRDPKA
jgi:uncharacterized protein DUF6599